MSNRKRVTRGKIAASSVTMATAKAAARINGTTIDRRTKRAMRRTVPVIAVLDALNAHGEHNHSHGG